MMLPSNLALRSTSTSFVRACVCLRSTFQHRRSFRAAVSHRNATNRVLQTPSLKLSLRCLPASAQRSYGPAPLRNTPHLQSHGTMSAGAVAAAAVAEEITPAPLAANGADSGGRCLEVGTLVPVTIVIYSEVASGPT